MPVPVVEQFGGLNLVDDPGSVGWSGAIDLLNVDFDRRGRVRSRDGTEQFSTSDSGDGTTSNISNLFGYVPTGASSKTGVLIIASSGGATSYAQTVSTAGVVSSFASAHSWNGTSRVWFVHFGAPTEESVYFSRPKAVGANTIGKYNGSAFSGGDTSATVDGVAGRRMPEPHVLAVTPKDNRLVATGFFSNTLGGPNDAASNPSRVYFSDAGAPETWDTDNWVDLHPGDGESITAAATWGDYLFVFKQTKYFVFYGNSTDSTGNPVFNYRTVDTGVGIDSSSEISAQFSVVAGPDALYFVGTRGIYRTAGSPPERISDAIDPLFIGGASSFWQGSATLGSGITFFEDRLHIRGTGHLVYDPRERYWTYWADYGSGTGLAPWRDQLYMAVGKRVNRFSTSVTTDAGTAIVSRYRSGFSDLNNGLEKEILETKVWGTGTPSFAWSADYGSLDTAAAVTLGTSPAIAQGRHLVAKYGELFSYQASATSGAWTVNRVAPVLAPGGWDSADRP